MVRSCKTCAYVGFKKLDNKNKNKNKKNKKKLLKEESVIWHFYYRLNKNLR